MSITTMWLMHSFYFLSMFYSNLPLPSSLPVIMSIPGLLASATSSHNYIFANPHQGQHKWQHPHERQPPLSTPLLLDPTVSELDPWNPEASVALDVTTIIPSPSPSVLPLPPPTLVVEPWKLAHTSHHKFYELNRSINNNVLFQVKLHGVMPAFKDKKYKYNKSSSLWFLVYFLQDSGGSPRVLAMD
ncbi:hypothetical protein AAF712_014085 [Marasmius tenuissimus]|uniref:Uncharacterized protein n=1 Tax=Marasmius tenuissimus TaxID=585030 RepID=A0ABR2ZE38_9AGAR